MKQNNILKRKIIDICRILYEKDMVSSTGGNVSIRENNQIFITQSGKSLGRLTLQMIVKTNLKEEVLEGEKPSKEISMHCAIYKARKDVNAVVHTHSIYSTVLSCIATPLIFCKECYACSSGRKNICLNRITLGYELDGGFAEYIEN